MHKQRKTYNIIQNVGFYFDFYKRNIPLFLWICLLEIILGSLAPYLEIYLPKLIVELVTGQYSEQKVILIISLFGLLCICVFGAKSACEQGKYFWHNTKRSDIMAELFLKSLKVPFSYTEAGPIKDLYWKAIHCLSTGDWGAMYKMTYGSLNVIKNSISFLLYSTVLGYLSPWIVVMLIGLSVMQYALSISRIKYMERFRQQESDLNRKQSYLLHSAMGNKQAAKDIRIFNMKKLLFSYKDKILNCMKDVKKKKARVQQTYWQVESLMALGRDLCAYIYLIAQTRNGVISAGEFVLYFGAITGFSAFVNSIMDSIAELREGSIATNDIRGYLDLPDEEIQEGTKKSAQLDTPISISFRDVSFRYQEAEDQWIYRHLNLQIKAGEKIAIVGVNGAGKTTLVKLLCGLYEPTEGEILFNNIPMKEFSKRQLYQLFSAVFQEPFIMPFTMGENLALSKTYDEDKCKAAIEAAGLSQLFADKKVTLDTYFGKDIDETGIELSGGQTQRFLLARALYKDAPILVLDEPTAALDPIAESEIYDQYAKYAKGKTAFFISHRLASTRFSDRIILVGNQGIIEEGTHEELLERKGPYAEMFQIQKSYYEKDRLVKEAFE